ncbi:twin-arginine translocase subunit TatC [Neolewinella antarctica]|uniref:Sec-independent protein translocase protein TatC n=1 Tax=Neolewinella antarctica TaxID=442734 RepID=A0ABX0XEM2_9BACT|nr:twin-arginine translocase subunit TatC [Neolewinella antarctica]NJC27560.1 sec-independent protein translocase protein TatC [Neolewinella antarctica]
MPLDQMNVDDWEMDEHGRPLPPVEKEMSFIDHLEELRWHVVRSLVAILIGGIGLFIFRDWYFERILFGPMQADFISYEYICKWTGGSLCLAPPESITVQAIGMGEQFITSVKMAFVGGFVIAFPYVFYEFWSFIRPGLYAKEQQATRWVILISSLLFFIGISFGFLVVAPFGTYFLTNFTVGGAENIPTMDSVIGYMTMFTLPAALIFELPIVVHFLASFGLVTAEAMRKYRKHSLIGILILASVMTPPDVVTQVLIAVPLYSLYEISIFVAKRAQRKYEADLDAPLDSTAR